MKRLSLILYFAATPAPALAHDAFGDLGPFYASLLHPLADPMQAALVLGTAAFLAGRSLDRVRVALPVFMAAAALSHLLLSWRLGLVPPPIVPAAAAVAVGGAATLPDRWTRPSAALLLVAVTGALVGLAPDRPPAAGALQPVLGTLLGIAALTTLAWAALDALARRVSGLAPAVAGSWVTAVGLLAGAFALQPVDVDAVRLDPPLNITSAERSEP
jgi:uncharacterized membrane protein